MSLYKHLFLEAFREAFIEAIIEACIEAFIEVLIGKCCKDETDTFLYSDCLIDKIDMMLFC